MIWPFVHHHTDDEYEKDYRKDETSWVFNNTSSISGKTNVEQNFEKNIYTYSVDFQIRVQSQL